MNNKKFITTSPLLGVGCPVSEDDISESNSSHRLKPGVFLGSILNIIIIVFILTAISAKSAHSYEINLDNKDYKVSQKVLIDVKDDANLIKKVVRLLNKYIYGYEDYLEIVDPKNNIVFKEKLIKSKKIEFNNYNKPGKYIIKKNGIEKGSFTWGVLAMNTNKSYYLPFENVKVDMAVLNEFGWMVCDAKLRLTIIDPDGISTIHTTENKLIVVNSECASKDLTDKPDYFTNITPEKQGFYNLILDAEYDNKTHTIKDGFYVNNETSIDVERVSNTRIFPQHIYKVDINLKNKNLTDIYKVVDKVPKEFKISQPLDSRNFTLTEDLNTQSIIWYLDENTHQKTLSYLYDAPDISPHLFLLGEIEIYNSTGSLIYKDIKKWSIASDAVAHEQTVTGSATGSITSVTTSSSITGVTNHLYLASISQKSVRTVTSVSGLGLTWSEVGSICGGRSQTKVDIWYAIGTPSGDGTVTANFNASATDGVIAVSRYSGIDTSSPIGNTVKKNSNGINGACSGGTDSTTYTVDITTTVDNALVVGAVGKRQYTHTQGSGYTERADISTASGGNSAGVATQDKILATAGTTAYNGTTSSANDYSIVALEVKPAVANSPPQTPTLDSPANSATGVSLTPSLLTTTTDTDSDYLRYRIELCENSGMTVNCQTYDQTSSQTGWSGQNTQTSTAYTSGTQGIYTLQSPLSANTTYYWKSEAIDPAGSNTWSGTQTSPYSFTTTNSPTSPTSLQTESSTNPTGIIDLTPEFSAIHNDPDGDSATHYEIEVNTASNFSGTVMWDSGQQSMTTTNNSDRSPEISYNGTALSYNGSTYYWRIRFWDNLGAVGEWSATNNFTLNSIPQTPTLDSPANSATGVSLTPSLLTTTTDTDSDYLRYRIELCENEAMTTNCQTYDQTSSQTGWSGQNTQTSTAYTSGTQGIYTLQSPLTALTTYYWRSYAIDPAGSNTWSGTQTPRSFTTQVATGTLNFKGLNFKGINLE